MSSLGAVSSAALPRGPWGPLLSLSSNRTDRHPAGAWLVLRIPDDNHAKQTIGIKASSPSM